MKKAQIGSDKLMVAVIVLFVVAVVILGAIKLDVLGKIKNIFPSFNRTIDDKIDIERCPVPVAKIVDKNGQISLCNDNLCTKERMFSSYLWFDKSSQPNQIYISGKVWGKIPIALIYSNKVSLVYGILEGNEEIYYDIGDKLPVYYYLANLQGSDLIGNYFCRDEEVSFDIPESFKQVASIEFFNGRRIINIPGIDRGIVYFNKKHPDQIFIDLAGYKHQDIKIGEVAGSTILLDLKYITEELTEFYNPSTLVKIDNAHIFGDKIIKEKSELELSEENGVSGASH